MIILLYCGLFLISVVITLGACTLFTNAIEWIGKRFNLSAGAIGGVLAAIGTTLPETMIPVVAIFWGASRNDAEVGLGAILGAPFMLSTLVIPILSILLVVYAKLGKRTPMFQLNYRETSSDLSFFLVAYSVAFTCVFIPYQLVHILGAVGLVGLYLYYVKLKFSEAGEEDNESVLEPLFFARAAVVPSFPLISVQIGVGLAGLALGAQLFVIAAKTLAVALSVSPLLLALLIAPMATELPEMSNSFLWLYRKKDRLAVGNVTGAMVFQGTIPVSIGLLGTDWELAPMALITMGLALIAATFLLVQAIWSGLWRPWVLSGSAVFYIGYVLYLSGS